MISANILSTNIKFKLGSFFSTDSHSPTDIIRYINSAVQYLLIKKNFPFAQYSFILNTDDINTEYNIPYQIETFYVLDSSGDEIDLYSFQDYFRQKDKTNKVCAFEEKLITTNKGQLTIYYRGFPDMISSLDDTLEVPSYFQDLIILIGSYYGFMDVKAFDKANTTKGVMDGMINDLAQRNGDKTPLSIKRMNKSKSNNW